MRKNAERVLEAWKMGREYRRASSCWTDGQNVWSYATCLATRDGVAVVMNAEKYSPTTSNYQSAIRQWARWEGLDLIEVDTERGRGAQPHHLTDALALSLKGTA